MTWSTTQIADALEAGLSARARLDDQSQAVYGFDALDELGLHPIIADSLKLAGYGTHPEHRYPGHWHKSRKSEGLRCDLVLTHDGLPIRDPELRDTLFDVVDAADAEDAYWLEIKTVAQFEIAGPFPRYASELLQPVTQDVKKIWSDGIIHYGGLLLVLFTADQQTAEHDLAAWHHRCLDKGYPVGPPAIRGFPINERIGNAYCTAALYGVRGV